jgi:CRP-like cAMP-binding protein
MDELDTAVTRAQRVLALRSFPLFEQLTPSDLAVLAQHVRPRFFPRGSELLHPGIPVRCLHFVLRGAVEMVRSGKPNEQVGAHGVVGGLAVLAQDADGEQAIAAADTVTLQLGSEDLEDVFEDNFSILAAVLQVVAREQIRARQLVRDNAGLDPALASASLPLVMGELGLVERTMCLRQTMDFANTRIQALADLAQEAKPVTIEPGHQIWSEGERADYSLVVVAGGIEASGPGLRFVASPGSMIGAAESLAREPRWYDARAKAEVRALRIEAERIFDVIEDHMDLATDLLRVFARSTRGLKERVSLLDAEKPIA